MESEELRLRARVEELERRLEEVEQRLGIRTPPPLPVVFRSEPEPVPAPPAPTRAEPPADTVETKAGLVWVNRIGAITVILSVAFGFKYAVDNEWIGPSGRVMLGLLAGAVALVAGDKLWWRGHKSFAQGITALGVSIFYLSFYAAYQLYSLIPQSVAFIGAVVTTLAGGALALRYDARAIAALALFGGYMSPALASSGHPNDRFFGAYLFVLNAIALALVRRKQWLSVEIAAAAATLILVTAWIANAGHRLDPVEGSLFVTLQFVVFVLSPFFRIRMLAPVPAMIGIAFLCQEYSSPAYWPWAAIVSIIGVGVAWRDRDDRLLAPSFAGWAIGLLAWSPYLISHGALFAGLTAGFLGYFAATILLPAAGGRSLATYTTLAANAIFYFGVCYAKFNAEYHGYMGLLALAVAASYLAGASYLKSTGAPQQMLLVSAGLALSFVTLAIPIQLSGYSITLAWAVESAVLAYLAARLQSRWAFAGSWVIGVLALGMLFGEDARRALGTDYTPILNARFIPFVVVALSLGANAYWTMPRELALLPFAAAHLTLLTGLHMEIFTWIRSSHEPGSDLTSQLTFASSVLLATYGLAVLAHGIGREFRPHRLLGLGLFAVVVVKLYLFDIWQLGRLYRILAFVAIGGLLLSGSYLYSRYRYRLLALLQDETRST
jgi:uncharacterized membrane protein